MGEAKRKAENVIHLKNTCRRHADGTKIYCGEDCDYVKRMEKGMQDIVSMIKQMEASCEKAKLALIAVTQENMRLEAALKGRVIKGH